MHASGPSIWISFDTRSPFPNDYQEDFKTKTYIMTALMVGQPALESNFKTMVTSVKKQRFTSISGKFNAIVMLSYSNLIQNTLLCLVWIICFHLKCQG